LEGPALVEQASAARSNAGTLPWRTVMIRPGSSQIPKSIEPDSEIDERDHRGIPAKHCGAQVEMKSLAESAPVGGRWRLK
jgi:hypothetical protein